MSPKLLLSSLLMLTLPLSAQSPSANYPGGTDYVLWPGAAPGSEEVKLVETVIERSKDSSIHDRALVGITQPTITAFLPDKPTGAALLVAPGGAFRRVVIDKEGLEMAQYFSKRGVAVFVLKYRLAAEGHSNRTQVALQDGQRAMRLIRANAAAFKVDPSKIGVMGFSAGGHVAAMLSTYAEEKAYEPVDEADRASAKPDFQILVYPFLMVDAASVRQGPADAPIPNDADSALITRLSLEKQVSPKIPETLIIQADDDKTVPSFHAIAYYSALRKAGVKAELHVFRDGAHGFGIRGVKGKPASVWPELAEKWMTAIGVRPE